MKQLLLTIVLGLAFYSLNAQTRVSSSGNTEETNQGSISYTVGQVAYTNNTNDSQFVNTGIQDADFIVTNVGKNEKLSECITNLYPNPTLNFITVEFGCAEDGIEYYLINETGAILQKGQFSAPQIRLDFSQYERATYYLEIRQGNSKLSHYKVVKI